MPDIQPRRVTRQMLEECEAERDAYKAELLEQVLARRKAEAALDGVLAAHPIKDPVDRAVAEAVQAGVDAAADEAL